MNGFSVLTFRIMPLPYKHAWQKNLKHWQFDIALVRLAGVIGVISPLDSSTFFSTFQSGGIHRRLLTRTLLVMMSRRRRAT